MRKIGKKENVDSEKVRAFFESRAIKYDADHPYTATMYQDGNTELVTKRDDYEKRKFLHLMELTGSEKILDLGCGVGRWLDAIEGRYSYYLGYDYCQEFIDIAVERHINIPNCHFEKADITKLEQYLKNEKRKFDVFIIIGVLMYINDNILDSIFRTISEYASKYARVLVREPVGLESRLTLKDFFSDELHTDYHAIYRTRDELIECMQLSQFLEEFTIEKEDFLFSDSDLNNRTETAQYYFYLKRR